MRMIKGFIRIWLVVSAAAASVLLVYVVNQSAPAWVTAVLLSPLFLIPITQTDELLATVINWVRRGFHGNPSDNPH